MANGNGAKDNPHGKGPPFVISNQVMLYHSYQNKVANNLKILYSPKTVNLSAGIFITLPPEIFLQVYTSLEPCDQRAFGLTCKYVARIVMQCGLKSFQNWQDAMDFFGRLYGSLPTDDRWVLCGRCWIFRSAIVSWPCCKACMHGTTLLRPNGSSVGKWKSIVDAFGAEYAVRELRKVMDECLYLAAEKKRKQLALATGKARLHEKDEGSQQATNQHEVEAVALKHGMALRSSKKEQLPPGVDEPREEVQHDIPADGRAQPRRSLRMPAKKIRGS